MEKNMSELMKKPKILVTGAPGYIGSHVCKVLFERGYQVIGLDIRWDQNDVTKYCDRILVKDVNKTTLDQDYDAVVHLAGLISVEESTKKPAHYYNTNLNGTLNMLGQINYDTHFIFASTAGAFDAQSPYARSKVAAEDVIKEQAEHYTIFRFFNVAGSDGENMQQGKSTHLIRIAAECAAGVRNQMHVYGTDYDTPDGTCVRDYIHVVDLANAIANAIWNGPKNTPYECIGSGKGYSVKEVIQTMKKVSGMEINVLTADRRAGDPPILTIDNQFDGLEIKHNLEDMCRSAYTAELVRNGVL
jgi:UDP-glucose 4-epimerase